MYNIMKIDLALLHMMILYCIDLAVLYCTEDF